MADRDQVKKILRSLLVSTQNQITIQQLNKDYCEMEGQLIPYQQLGFADLESFLRSISDTLQVCGSGRGAVVVPVVDEATSNIYQLVATQKSNVKTRYRPKRKSFRPTYNIPRNTYRSPQPRRESFNANTNMYSPTSSVRSYTMFDSSYCSTPEPKTPTQSYQHNINKTPSSAANPKKILEVSTIEKTENVNYKSQYNPSKEELLSCFESKISLGENYKDVTYKRPFSISNQTKPVNNETNSKLIDLTENSRSNTPINSRINEDVRPPPGFQPKLSDKTNLFKNDSNDLNQLTSKFNNINLQLFKQDHVQYNNKHPNNNFQQFNSQSNNNLQHSSANLQQIYFQQPNSNLQYSTLNFQQPNPHFQYSTSNFQQPNATFKQFKESQVENTCNFQPLQNNTFTPKDSFQQSKENFAYSDNYLQSKDGFLQSKDSYLSSDKSQEIKFGFVSSKSSESCKTSDDRKKFCDEEADFSGNFINYKVPFNVQKNLRDLIRENPNGVWCRELPTLYKKEFSYELEFASFGYKNMYQMCADLPYLFTCVQVDNMDFRIYDCTKPIIHISSNSTNLKSDTENKVRDDNAALPDINDLISVRLTMSFPPEVLKYNDKVERQWIKAEYIQEIHVDVLVTDIYDISKFWVMLLRQECYGKWNSMVDAMQDFYRENVTIMKINNKKLLRIGQFCVCTFKDEYHRALIVNNFCDNADVIKVFCIDYGTITNVQADRVFFLHHQFAVLPAQAIRARLGGVVPPKKNVPWSSKSTHVFLNLVLDKRLVSEFVNIDFENKVLELNLYDTSKPEVDVNISEELLKRNLAIRDIQEQEDFQPCSVPNVDKIFLYPTFDEIENAKVPTWDEMLIFEKNFILHSYILPQYYLQSYPQLS